ncbi:MAG: hypothetical protein BWK78_06765 [Thiotrichaceae bacterium IS1]|nr:MAG: hypothetical protein BWK78_06765 [Thiotrichaceae bacterium IS1]
MNFYFVFEGKTEPIVYKGWLSVLLPQLTEVDSFDAVDRDNYYWESGMGVSNCYNVVANAIQEINEVPKYDYLVLCIDADNLTIAEKKQESHIKIAEKLADKKKNYTYQALPNNCQFVVIVQQVCIETWFLGNRKFFVPNPQTELLREYIEYFDVSIHNPEDLANEFVQNNEGTLQIFGYSTKAQFHAGYFGRIYRELTGRRYGKAKFKEISERYYLEQLLARIETNPEHLMSFQEFIGFCHKIKEQV